MLKNTHFTGQYSYIYKSNKCIANKVVCHHFTQVVKTARLNAMEDDAHILSRGFVLFRRMISISNTNSFKLISFAVIRLVLSVRICGIHRNF